MVLFVIVSSDVLELAVPPAADERPAVDTVIKLALADDLTDDADD